MPLPDRYTHGNVQRRADCLKIGDRLDLEADIFADPSHDDPEFQFQFVTVVGLERETAESIRVDIEGRSFGFPPDHWLDVDGEQPR